MLLKNIIIVVFLFFTRIAFSADPIPILLSFEQRMLLSYAVQSIGLSPEESKKLARQAAEQFRIYEKTQPQVIEVATFDEFLTKWKGEWPNTYSLDLDLKIILKSENPIGPRKFKAVNPDLQKQIDSYVGLQIRALANILNVQLPQILKPGVLALPAVDQPVLQLFEAQFNVVQTISSRLVESHLGHESSPTEKAFGLAVKTFLSQYYRDLGLDSKKRIVGALLGEDLNLPEIGKFEIAVQNSGPILQKMLQVVAREVSGPIKAVFSKLENAVKPVPWVLVKEILSPQVSGYQFDSVVQKELAGASMCQTHLVTLNKVTRVARFIKPGIEAEIEQDTRILVKAAAQLDASEEYLATGAPKMSTIVNDIRDGVAAELDFNETMKNQSKAVKVYAADVKLKHDGESLLIHFRVPEVIYPPKLVANQRVMVQEFAPGSKIEKSVNDPELKRILVETMTRQWVKELLFGSFFYHEDLHHGNYHVYVNNDIHINILDYGMAGQLTPNQRNYLLLFGIGLKSKQQELITESLWQVSAQKKNQVTKVQFKEKSRLFVQQNPNAGMLEWISFAVGVGISLDSNFINMNRGAVILNKTLAEYKSDLTVSKIMMQESRKHPLQISLLMSRVGNMTWLEIIKFGTHEVAEITMNKCRSYFTR